MTSIRGVSSVFRPRRSGIDLLGYHARSFRNARSTYSEMSENNFPISQRQAHLSIQHSSFRAYLALNHDEALRSHLRRPLDGLPLSRFASGQAGLWTGHHLHPAFHLYEREDLVRSPVDAQDPSFCKSRYNNMIVIWSHF